MKSKLLKFLSFLFAVTFILILVFTACNKEEKEDNGKAPEIPPESAFVIDFSNFSGQQKSTDEILTTQNYSFAAFNVAIWNAIITIGLAVPVASYVEAFNHEAEYQGNTTWKWTYNFQSVYTAELYGTIEKDSVVWTMYISKSNEFDKFLWYSGTCDIAATGGYWVLNKSPEENHKLLKIEWTRNKTNQTGTIKYTNVEPGGSENGGYIYYGFTDGTPYNAFYDIYNKGLDRLIEIEWNRDDHSGRVKAEFHFGDTDWHCWDIDYQDIDC
ncbi:MAG: hypothetical protein KAT68_18220 [Bacteroidales bacterium]|nr:hypothetical protein [Bacteroidales bacterium]